MSSSISALEEMKSKIQEDIISRIANGVDESSKIRFWAPDERISDDEIDKAYPEIYQIYVTIPKPKGSKKQPLPQVLIGRNFDAAKESIYNQVYLRLETSTIVYLKAWGRRAATIVNKYLNDNGDYALQKVRFDLLPDSKKETFVIPNLPLENIHFYNPRHGYNAVIDTDAYVEEQIETAKGNMEAAEAFRIAVLKAQGKL